jgi:fumarate hydratase subunit alpha
MKIVLYKDIVNKVSDLCGAANFDLNECIKDFFKNSLNKEKKDLPLEALKDIIDNYKIAKLNSLPLCQDTGVAVFFVEIGSQVQIKGGLLSTAIQAGMVKGYKKFYLRKSMCNPFTRENTSDNSPAIIHTEIVKGNKLRIFFLPKGGGAENMSRLSMLKPSASENDIIKFVVESVVNAGPNACPPVFVGVGIGGNFETSALLSKKALLRPLKDKNKNQKLANLEKEILKEINKSGIGTLGLGGKITAMAVKIELLPCHIASLPVAVNINCHSHRYGEIVL